MPAFNFQSRFADDVLSGLKSQTIRANRKDGLDPKPGSKLILYTGMRTNQCRKLREVTCRQRDTISIIEGTLDVHVQIDGLLLPVNRRDQLAINDGFRSWDDMLEWFKAAHGLPFEGYIYHW